MGHIHRLIDFVVTIFMVHDNRVLLVHHKRYDKWLPIGGHIELDEDPEQALWREIKEECGMSNREVTLLTDKPVKRFANQKFLLTPNYLDIHDISGQHKHVGLTYFARAKTEKVLLSNEHYDMAWFDREEIGGSKINLGDQVKFYALSALEKAKMQ